VVSYELSISDTLFQDEVGTTVIAMVETQQLLDKEGEVPRVVGVY
jgi:hypothetical protein